MAAGGRRDFQGGHEREICDRTVASDEEDEVAAGGDLAGDAFEVVAGSDHEIETGRVEGRGVVGDEIESRARVLFVHGTERLDCDVVETAEFVAAGGIVFRRDPVPAKARLKFRDAVHELPRRPKIADAFHDVGFGADRLVDFSEHAGAAVADGFVHDGSGEGIAGYAGEGIGPAALERDAQRGEGLGGAACGGDDWQPAAHDFLALGEGGGETAANREKGVRHIVEGVAAVAQEGGEAGVGDGLDTVVDGEHGADVGMHHETGERAEDLEGVVGFAGTAALGVGDGDNAVERGVHAGEGLQAGGELARETRGARGGAEDDEGVAGADAAPTRAAKTLKCAESVGERRGWCGREGVFVERKLGALIGEVGAVGPHGTVELADGEHIEGGLVAHVVARCDVDERGAERKSPRKQRCADGDGSDGEAVAFEDGVRGCAGAGREGEEGAGFEAARGDGDIIAGSGEAADGGQSEGRKRHRRK